MSKLIDVHTHTQFAAYNEDRDAVIRRALDAGMWLINVGTQRDTSKAAVDLAHKYEGLPAEASAKAGVFATVGLHPIHSEKSFHDLQELGAEGKGEDKGFLSRGEIFDCNYYKKLAEDPKVVAIGECGLDYYHLTEETKTRQAENFKYHVELSSNVKKPLMIHCREAFSDLIALLTEYSALLNKQPGVCHFFTGSEEDAKKLLDLGFSFSFGGVITFPLRLAERSRGEAGASAYEKLVKFIPLDRIVLETDAPYVAPQAYRGKRNEPLYVEEVAKKMGKILNKDFEEIARITTENAIRVFGLK
ncbi:MAG: Hydrolase, TatD family [Candidatus Giovannonibacteria bacterium GW2011_GWA2_44_13b]|uniref:Hydrolase, TatD family n=2 Tax=Candidatus Giovannoniibacteriota TaxID=1752738 RepID=A0A0G1H2U3_9BACT|nr:MAG: Hydrolase, TatD family [Candidatus Giovannonibacteria bacterium GW2011_GWA2_44_13b]OGF81543.1 MAG: hypothetical protein A2924_03445 [Candidatus Giovannonibacteria bacterium RIFCSPLOWO2_01_FULL_44_16]